MMGCQGCELWNRERKICYAGRSTENKKGQKGWPESFDKPTLFLERVEPTLKWGPLTEREREAKPWIPADYPRVIFLNDMGDTFSTTLPLNWMAPLLPRIAASPHQFLVLTKRPSMLRKFAERFPLPANLWPGTTFKGIQWAIFGGESGTPGERPTAFKLKWLEKAMLDATTHLCRRFVKQLGSNPTWVSGPLRLKDFHGGDWNEWPPEFRIREMPMLASQPILL
jgi:protein gp37